MKTCLLFILAFVCLIVIFGEISDGVVYAENINSQIQISAYVPEHISYRVTSGVMEVSTNKEGGLWVLGGGESSSGNMVKVNIDSKELSSFVIIPKI